MPALNECVSLKFYVSDLVKRYPFNFHFEYVSSTFQYKSLVTMETIIGTADKIIILIIILS